MKIQDLFESDGYRLKDLCQISTDFPDAHFWITRRGSEDSVGSVTKEYNKESFGIGVTRPDIVLPDYLYYALMNLHMGGYWKGKTQGVLQLVHIRKEDVENIRLG